jgi:hypothetical protein
MKAKLSSVMVYDVSVGEMHLGHFRVTSNWEGMIKLEDAIGRVLIVEAPKPIEEAMTSILPGGTSEVEIHKAAPDLIAKISSTATELLPPRL